MANDRATRAVFRDGTFKYNGERRLAPDLAGVHFKERSRHYLVDRGPGGAIVLVDPDTEEIYPTQVWEAHWPDLDADLTDQLNRLAAQLAARSGWMGEPDHDFQNSPELREQIFFQMAIDAREFFMDQALAGLVRPKR